jgi:hypothetical protein
MGAAATLLKFAKSRQAAYLKHGQLSDSRARAISLIKQVADFFSQKNDQVQLIAVRQIEAEILSILPAEESRFKSIRKKILTLLQDAKNITHHDQNRIQPPLPTHGGTDRHPKADPGKQLSLMD